MRHFGYGLVLMTITTAWGGPIAQAAQPPIEQRQASQLQSLTKAANAAADQGKYAEALAIYLKIWAQVQSGNDLKLQGQVLSSIGITYRQSGDYLNAIRYQQKALEIKRQLQDVLGEGVLLRGLGLTYRDQKNYDQALKFFQQAQVVLLNQPDRYWQMISWYDLGNLYYRTEAYEQSVQAFQTALPIAQELKRPQTIGEILSKIGFSYHDGGKLSQAVAAYQKSLPYLKSTLPDSFIDVHIQMGRAQNQLGQPKAAIATLGAALSLAKNHPKPRFEYLALYNLGMIYNGLGSPQEAQPYLQKALTIAQTTQSKEDQQLILAELGLMRLNQGDYTNAINTLQKSLDLAIQIKDQEAEQGVLANLGIVYYNLGEYRQAFDIYNRALVLARQSKDVSLEGRILGSLGILYRAISEYEKALPFTQASLKIAKAQQDSKEQKVSLLDLGLLYNALDRPQEAIESYQAALELAKNTGDRSLEGKLYGNLGLLYDQQREYRKASELFRSSLEIAKTTGDLREKAVALSNLGSTLYHLGELSEAEGHLRESIGIWNQQRNDLNQNRQYNTADRQKISLFERQSITYRELQRVLVKQNRPEAALEVTEQSRTRALVELIGRKRQYSAERLKENLNVTIAQLQKTAREQSATIVEYSLIGDWVDITNSDPKQSKQVKRDVKDADLLIWVIQPNGKVTLRQVDLRPWVKQENFNFDQIIDRGRREIGVRDRGVKIARVSPGSSSTSKQPVSLSQLHQILIEPIQDLLPTRSQDHIILIPHKYLFAVPFYALQDRQGKYLIESHTLRIAPSLQILGLTRHTKNPSNLFSNPLIIGNPQMPSLQESPNDPITPLDNLPNAEQEAKQISALFQTTALTGSQAKKSIVLQRMRDAKLIHFATHGLLDDFSGLGLPGAIALAPDRPGKPNDGLLLSDELMDEKFQLSADLVVLSACNTGQGRITGDGVVGLSRAFLAAGVPSVVVSLWAVDDNSTSILMTEFYRNLQKDGDRAASLRQAMLTTKQQFPDPYHWAAFTLVGQSPSKP